MVTYEVTTIVDPSQVEAYERYMCEHHIPDLLGTGCFRAATFTRGAHGRYRTCYEAGSERDLERYMAEHAARLRADFGSHFPDVTVAAREVWHTVQRWETEHVDIAHDA
jgi:hypothetical protein